MSDDMRAGLLAQDENSISDIRQYLAGDEPFQPNEFTDFWRSLSEDEKREFKKADLTA